MSTQIKKLQYNVLNDDITIIEHTGNGEDFYKKIINQLDKTYSASHNLLQEIERGIFLFTLRKNDTTTALQVKKLCDRAQYIILPTAHNNEQFYKISFNNLKNQCHGLNSPQWIEDEAFHKPSIHCHIFFFYRWSLIEQSFRERLKTKAFSIREILSNRMMIISNGAYSYPLSMTKLTSIAIYLNQTLTKSIQNELDKLDKKFLLFEELFLALKKTFPDNGWVLNDGHMHFTHRGVTRSFDYASLADDIIFAGFEHRLGDYLKHFQVHDLDSSSSFPTVAIRSNVHLKVRPESLSRVHNGYAVVCAKESNGKQTAIDKSGPTPANGFDLWLSRASRHLFRHLYRARVIFESHTDRPVFSLVGEQIATIALFPPLVRGVFEALHLAAPKSVRLIAHNEDILTIAHDTASWIDINNVNQKATTLFKLISNDGADPLTLFEQIKLPDTGVGNFQLQNVPNNFFELVECANNLAQTLPRGHNHYLLGLAYECVREWGMAVLELKKALRFDTKDPDILHALGCALMEIGEVSEALPFLKHAFDLMPEDPEVANNWGRSNLECGQLADAISAFERAVRLSPGSADYLKNLGDGYLLAARPSDALEMLNKAIRCDPHYATAHASLAHLYLATGDEAQAKKHALLAYKENPLDANIANLLWHLTLEKK